MRALLLITLSWLLAFASPVQAADSGLRRFEIGIQTADVRTGCIGSAFSCPIPSFALGAGGAMNLNPHFSLDANFLITPQSASYITNTLGGHASELLLGARAEVRARHYGFFLKAQSGYFSWSHLITDGTYRNPSVGRRTYFASNAGAGLEYSPSARIHLRGEITDLVLHEGNSWTNNLQPSAGIYYGLGKQIQWKPPVYEAKRAHRFDDTANLVLLTASTLSITADAITTQRDLARGDREGDPFARPLVKYGWSGEVSAMALEIGAEILGMYGLHRIGQHRAERLVPVSLAIAHAIFAYNNAHVSPSGNGSE
ncbi:MAG TPA: outer membrane beta-barrel protein [Acidobacteriaceae bacterium]|nr:outer membrane beta-barrel protein [Acidobacteriaceae bacterium]